MAIHKVAFCSSIHDRIPRASPVPEFTMACRQARERPLRFLFSILVYSECRFLMILIWQCRFFSRANYMLEFLYDQHPKSRMVVW